MSCRDRRNSSATEAELAQAELDRLEFEAQPKRPVVRQEAPAASGCYLLVPLESISAAIPPQSIGETKEYLKRRGVSVDFTNHGSPIFRSFAHQKEYCRAMGLHNKRDPQA